MDLSTPWLGLRLKNPLIVGASPMVDEERWMAEHGYDSVDSLRGTLSLARCPDPAAYERANYMQMLQSWQAPAGW
jgi:hypothetical protein